MISARTRNAGSSLAAYFSAMAFTDFAASRRVSSLIDSLSPYQISKVSLLTLLVQRGGKRGCPPEPLAGPSGGGGGGIHDTRAAARRLAAGVAHRPGPPRSGGARLASSAAGFPARQAGRVARARGLVAGLGQPGRGRGRQHPLRPGAGGEDRGPGAVAVLASPTSPTAVLSHPGTEACFA